MTDGVLQKQVKPENIDEYIYLGYRYGKLKTSRPKRVWMNNGVRNKQIDLCNIEDYLNAGYVRGKIRVNLKGSDDLL